MIVMKVLPFVALIAGFIASALICKMLILDLRPRICASEGLGSTALRNVVEVKFQSAIAVTSIKDKTPYVVYTMVDEVTARENLPFFMLSLHHLKEKTFLPSLLIYCTDDAAFDICRVLHLYKNCIYAAFNLPSRSPPRSKGSLRKTNFHRFSLGRLYIGQILVDLGIDTILVDTSSLFFKNPFDSKNGLEFRRNDVAIMLQNSKYNTNSNYGTIQSGLMYFPAHDTIAKGFSEELLERVWSVNCHPYINEQHLLSTELHAMFVKHHHNPHFNPQALSPKKYLSFCTETCGAGAAFSSAKSVADFKHAIPDHLDNATNVNATNSPCSLEGRQEWVFFHMACFKQKDTAAVQEAMLKWYYKDKMKN